MFSRYLDVKNGTTALCMMIAWEPIEMIQDTSSRLASISPLISAPGAFAATHSFGSGSSNSLRFVTGLGPALTSILAL